MRSALHNRPFARVAVALAAFTTVTVGLAGSGSATPSGPTGPPESSGSAAGVGGDADPVRAPVTDSGVDSEFSPRENTDALPMGQGDFEVLQFNLCNSGRNDDCYTGGASIPYAEAYIRYIAPHTVTLNEICRDDIDPLYEAFQDAWRRESYEDRWWTFWLYRVVEVHGGGAPRTCTNGEPYVIAVMGYVPDSEHTDLAAVTGVYHEGVQGIADEWRAWACATAGGYITCTTHLTRESDETAFYQCGTLTFGLLPEEVWPELGALPTTIGGDLNLTYLPGYTWNVQDCVPDGWFRKGDGHVQHVMASDAYAPNGDAITLEMDDTTDHQGLLVLMTEN